MSESVPSQSKAMPFASPRNAKPPKSRLALNSPAAGLHPAFKEALQQTPPRRPVTPIVIPDDDDLEEQSRRPHQAPLEDGQDWNKPLTDTPLARAKKKADFQPLVTDEERETLRAGLKEDHKTVHGPQQPVSKFASPSGGPVPVRMKTRPSRASSMGAGSPAPRSFRPVGLAKINIPDDGDAESPGKEGEDRSEHQAPLITGQDWSLPLTDTPLARAKKKPGFQPLVTEDERDLLRQSAVPEDEDGDVEEGKLGASDDDHDDGSIQTTPVPNPVFETPDGDSRKESSSSQPSQLSDFAASLKSPRVKGRKIDF